MPECILIHDFMVIFELGYFSPILLGSAKTVLYKNLPRTCVSRVPTLCIWMVDALGQHSHINRLGLRVSTLKLY